MKALFLVLSMFLFFCHEAHAGPTYGNLHNVTYLKTVSSESFLVNVVGQHPLLGDSIEVVLKGVVGPKKQSSCAQERTDAEKAGQLLDFLLKRAKNITLKNVERGRRFRIVATVLVDGTDVRDILLKKGLIRIKRSAVQPSWCR